uniref:interferon lambda receptor 1 n=1 Tax=Semicossyphus pulcher TaxID=241346 RepID=UPI0037E9BA7B
MKMWSMRVIILLLFCYACLSTDNRKVYFESRNFHNVLRWLPAEPAFPGQKVLYSVQYRSDADDQSFRIKEGCQNITALSCDLTLETPSLHDVHYQAQVYVNGSCHGRTFRFKPLADTTFGPPSLSTYTTVSSLHVNVTLPSDPKGVSIRDIITGSRNGSSAAVTVYVLKITQPTWAAQVNESTTGRFIINLKNNQTEYCGYVVYKPSAEWGRPESEKASFCAKLQDDPLMLLPWLLVSAALLAAVITIPILSLCSYVKGGKEKTMPQTLETPFSSQSRVLEILDGNLIISKPEFYTQIDQTVYATICAKPNVPSVGTEGYSPQDIPCRTWQGSVGSSVGTDAQTLNPEDTSGQSSEIYSFVAVHVPAEENKDGKRATTKDKETWNLPWSSSGERWDTDGISPVLTTHGVPLLTKPDSYESRAGMPVQLHTVRDPNGQLTLPSLTLQLQSNTSERERKPLLSDLIDPHREGPSLASFQSIDSSEWSDSGCDESSVNTPTHPYCNTNYFPSQPVDPYIQKRSSDASFDSGYKQNWLPEILLGMASKDSCSYRRADNPWTWTNDKMEEEAEEDEERGREEGSRQILLGGWGLQIQE